MAGFTKLDSGIVDSSIWDEPSDVLKVFQTFWVKSDAKGIVSATRESLFRTANLRDMSGTSLPMEWFDECLRRLLAPDPRSRSKDHDGRRIIQLAASSWQIVTYQEKRDRTYSSNPESIRKRQQRSGTSRDMSQNVPGHSASASLSVQGTGEVRKGVQGETIPKLKSALCSLYSRPPADFWAYDELSALVEISKRGSVIQEMETLRHYFGSLPAADRKFFPGSIGRLLQNWCGTLDKARMSANHKPASEKTLLDKQVESDARMIERL